MMVPSLGRQGRGLLLWLIGLHGVNVCAQPLRAQLPPHTVVQTTDYGCGAAALATVLRHWGAVTLTEAQVIERLTQLGVGGHSIEARGYSLAELASAAVSWGYEANGLRLTFAELGRLPLPVVVRLRTAAGPHFSVLIALDHGGSGKAVLADPSWGIVSLAPAHLAGMWLHDSGHGVALAVTPPAADVTGEDLK